ncbi:MAG: dolichyl-phosphate beta-glucosyltransferase [Patescibacteria group bacterium]|jgi:glycosyltransferase involved in cell wall biosynthesis
MHLSIIIPAFNEEQRISKTLTDYTNYFSGKDTEIIIVLNGCRDNTIGIVSDFKKEYPGLIEYIEEKKAIGKGGAVHLGFSRAEGELIGFVDADGSTEPAEFQKVVDQLGEADGVIASRWKKGSQVINRSFPRKLISFSFLIFVKVFFWMPFTDTQCGAKIFKKQAIKNLLPSLKITNMAFDVELLYLSLKRGFKIVEVPTRWVDKSSSAMLGSFGRVIQMAFKMFFSLMSIRLKK